MSDPAPGDARVDGYFARLTSWRRESERLRSFARETQMRETLKWGHPCYAVMDANVVLMHGFKTYVALLVFKGALMRDEAGLLARQRPNVRGARQMRFAGLAEIEARADAMRAYLDEAISLARAGAKIGPAPPREAPAQFARRLEAGPALAAAFAGLTPGRRRGYLWPFAGAKPAATGIARIERWRSALLAGKGVDD